MKKYFQTIQAALIHSLGGDTRTSLKDLNHFIEYRLPDFGTHQDAMWTNEPWLFHSLLSSSLNLKLLRARSSKGGRQAYLERSVSLAAVEGFIRQILGGENILEECIGLTCLSI